jgi:hypothetical protein
VVCNITGKIYIGSTCKELSNRLAGHRSDHKRYLAGIGNYVSSFEIIKNGNYDIILIEVVNAKNKMELRQRERHHIDSNECVNRLLPSRTKQQWNSDNADRIKATDKQYRSKYCDCPCGSHIKNAQRTMHKKSNKHINYIRLQQANA